MKKTVLILFGGTSSEYEVSLHSAAAMISAIDTGAWEPVAVGITRMGQWLYYPGGAAGIADDTWHNHPDCVPAVLSPSREDGGLWLMGGAGLADADDACACLKRIDVCLPVLHGRGGEDGTVQGLCELAGIPVAGCGLLASALCMDKDVAHRLAAAAGIPCPRYATVWRSSGLKAAVAAARASLQGIAFPWFVKPAAEGSSFGVARVDGPESLPAALENAFRYGGKVVVEEGISGFEVGCAILGQNENTFIGQVDAIELSGGFFDFHEKYTLESARILLPAPLSREDTEKVKQAALQIYRLLGCSGFARVDLFYTKDGHIVFNEVNTIPGMTAHSRFPGMLRAAGVPFEAMVSKILEGALAP